MMGMFDTIIGEYECPICGSIHETRITVKEFNCDLITYYVGDIVGDSDTTYMFKETVKCHAVNEWLDVNIIVKKGQLVGIYHVDYTPHCDANDYSNIEPNYYKLKLVENSKKTLLGTDFRIIEPNNQNYNVGDTYTIFDLAFTIQNAYKILPVYSNTLSEDIDDEFDCVYELVCGDIKRVLHIQQNGNPTLYLDTIGYPEYKKINHAQYNDEYYVIGGHERLIQL